MDENKILALKKQIASDLLSIRAVFFRPEEPFTWASGIKSPVYCDNRLTLTVKKQGAFRISVTGFDPNRDLEVSKKRYEYPEAKGED